MFKPIKIFTGETVNSLHLNKAAFDKGFKAFQKGDYYNNPYDELIKSADNEKTITELYLASKEWQRGQNAAYNMYLERNIIRESYREQRS